MQLFKRSVRMLLISVKGRPAPGVAVFRNVDPISLTLVMRCAGSGVSNHSERAHTSRLYVMWKFLVWRVPWGKACRTHSNSATGRLLLTSKFR